MAQLLASPTWAHVTTVGRRAGAAPPAQHADKLTQTVVDMDALGSEGAAAFAGADVAFCTLGTKRRIAGSAEAYIKAGCLTAACVACLAVPVCTPRAAAGACWPVPVHSRGICCHARDSVLLNLQYILLAVKHKNFCRLIELIC